MSDDRQDIYVMTALEGHRIVAEVSGEDWTMQPLSAKVPARLYFENAQTLLGAGITPTVFQEMVDGVSANWLTWCVAIGGAGIRLYIFGNYQKTEIDIPDFFGQSVKLASEETIQRTQFDIKFDTLWPVNWQTIDGTKRQGEIRLIMVDEEEAVARFIAQVFVRPDIIEIDNGETIETLRRRFE